jgi:hypothetical protein
MSYVLNRYNGSQLVVLEDGVLDNSTSVNLIGRNYTGYGSVQNENFVYLLENFSNTASPLRPLSGQLWYNSSTRTLKLYDGTAWKSSSSANVSSVAPSNPANGDFWFDSDINQLSVFNNNAWQIIGPEAISGYRVTQTSALEITDDNTLKHPALAVKVDGEIEVLFSSIRYTIDPATPITGFSLLEPGINLKEGSAVHGDLKGNADTATALKNAPLINGFMFTGESNITIKSSTFGTLTRGEYLVGSNFDGAVPRTWSVDAGPDARPGKIVARDASGGFAAVSITATTVEATNLKGKVVAPSGSTSTFDIIQANTVIGSTLAGNAFSADRLSSVRTINSVGFDGTANIIVPSAAETLTGTRLNSSVIESSLTTVGTLNSLSVEAAGIAIGSNNYVLTVRDNVSTIITDQNFQISIADTVALSGYSAINLIPADSAYSGDDVNPTVYPSGQWNIGAKSLRFNTVYASTANSLTTKTDTISPSTPGSSTVTVSNDLVVGGNFTVQGSVTTINSTQTAIQDLLVTLAKGAATPAAANGAGFEIDGAGATFTYTVSGNKWNVNKDLDAGANNFITTGSFIGTATSARYADLAENYQADREYEPGTVLEFGGEFEVTIAEDETRRVAGIVSTYPAYLMNSKLTGANVVALALQGRVPCKVRGKICKGDMLVSGGNGYARPTTDPKLGTIIGKALEDFDGIDGIIEVVVGRV